MLFLNTPKKQPQSILTSKVHKQLAIKPQNVMEFKDRL